MVIYRLRFDFNRMFPVIFFSSLLQRMASFAQTLCWKRLKMMMTSKCTWCMCGRCKVCCRHSQTDLCLPVLSSFQRLTANGPITFFVALLESLSALTNFSTIRQRLFSSSVYAMKDVSETYKTSLINLDYHHILLSLRWIVAKWPWLSLILSLLF